MSMITLMDGVKNLEDVLTCEICKNLLNDPLLVAKCGHSICRQCFVGNFSMKCPICQIPVNTKDSLEDKSLKELLMQLKKLRNILENDSKDTKSVSEEQELIDVDATNNSELSNNAEKATDVKTADKADAEIISPTAPSFSTSTPKIGRRKKSLPRGRPGRPSASEKSIQNTSENSESSTTKRKLESSNVSEGNKSKCDQSSNSSILSPFNLNKRNHKGETLLHRAVIKGDINKVKDLIAAGASVNTQDNNGWTPLHEASNHGFLEIARLLLDNGALVNVPAQKDNITPIHDALITDQMQIAILLASRGADMHAKTSLGLTALGLCKNEEDKATLIEACSPFISANVPLPSKKIENTENDKVVLLHTSLNDKQKEQLQKFSQMIKADIVDEFSPEVTHVITSCDKDGNCVRTMKMLLGLLSGKWIMNFQWIEVCLEYKQKVNEEVFEVQGTKNQPNSQGPKKSRENAEQKFPPLFDGFNFYLHGQFHKPTPNREELITLIHLGGGKILSREPREETVSFEKVLLPYHAAGTPFEGVNHIILYQEKPPRDHHILTGPIRTTQVIWLIECISEYKLKNCIHDSPNNK